mgnify:CR=1 FL=1
MTESAARGGWALAAITSYFSIGQLIASNFLSRVYIPRVYSPLFFGICSYLFIEILFLLPLQIINHEQVKFTRILILLITMTLSLVGMVTIQ